MSDLRWHKCNGSIKTYPFLFCHDCTKDKTVKDFDPVKRIEELERENEFLNGLLELRAVGVEE